jgi:hypothetical protein
VRGGQYGVVVLKQSNAISFEHGQDGASCLTLISIGSFENPGLPAVLF